MIQHQRDLVQRRVRPRTLSGHFDETGGNIGRGESNQLVLPDPERTISRVHAQVVFRNGRYAIIDRGSNPISVNGRPLGNGQEDLHPAGRRAADRRLRDAGRGRRGDRRAAGRRIRSPISRAGVDAAAAGGARQRRPRPSPIRSRASRRRAPARRIMGGRPPAYARRHRQPRRRRGRHSPGLGSVRARSEDDRAARSRLAPARSASPRRGWRQFRPRCRRPRRGL